MTTSRSDRLLSVDALRGFDMLLIAGGGTFITLLKGKTGWSWVDAIAEQFTHPAWHGFTFYDFIFPLFLFLAGVSVALSVDRERNKGTDKRVIIRRALRRMIILILLGIAYKNAPIPFSEPGQIRFGSVLGRIGIATMVTTLLFLKYNFKQRLIWVASILVGYYALLFLVPVPGQVAGDLSFEGNLVGWFDQAFMPGRLLQGTYDELALLTQFPALCLTILGAWAGELLDQRVEKSPVKPLAFIGVIVLALGLIWSLHFPINKHLWTSSFILLTSGMAFLFLALFYQVIENWGYRKWAFFFKVIGVNSLLVYLVYRFVNFGYTSKAIFGGLIDFFPEPFHDSLIALGSVGLVWSLLYFCYRKRIFLKI